MAQRPVFFRDSRHGAVKPICQCDPVPLHRGENQDSAVSAPVVYNKAPCQKDAHDRRGPAEVEAILLEKLPHIAEWPVEEPERFVTFISSRRWI
jgi:hypothetical protein